MSSSDTYTILLVDDEPEVRASVRRSLNVPGYTILEAGDATEAMAELKRRRFDAIVSDYQMPGIDGLELLQRIRILYPQMLRVLLTARADVQLAVRALNEGGCHRLFLKPWSSYDLRGVLRLALHLHQKTANASAQMPSLSAVRAPDQPADDTASIARDTLNSMLRGGA